MDPAKLPQIPEDCQNQSQSPFQMALERNRAFCRIGQSATEKTPLDIWVAPSEEMHQRFSDRQPRVRPRLETRPSFPESWGIGQNAQTKAEPQNISPKSPSDQAMPQNTKSTDNPFFPLSPKRPTLKQKPYSEADLSLRRFKTEYNKNTRVITESEWAETLAENQRIRAELDGFRVRFNSVVEANHLKEAVQNASLTKKSPWQKTKGFLVKQVKRYFADKP